MECMVLDWIFGNAEYYWDDWGNVNGIWTLELAGISVFLISKCMFQQQKVLSMGKVLWYL